jgi:phage-related protein
MLTPGGPGDTHASSRRKVWAYLEHVAQLQHPPRNTTVSHQIDEEYGIYEFIKGDLRVFYFYDEEATIVLSHGFIKSGQRTPRAEIKRARRSAAAYLDAKKQHALRYIEGDGRTWSKASEP